jgi:hypothetical protein
MDYLWILHSTGTVLYYQSNVEHEMNSDQTAGLLSALNSFSEEMIFTGPSSGGIESIEMAGLRWVYVKDPNHNLMCVAAAQKSMNGEVMRTRLEIIYKEFLTEFKLTPEQTREFDGLVGHFKTFNVTVNMFLKQWEMAEMALGAAEMFDVLGIFQQFFNLFMNVVRTNFFGNVFQEVITEIREFDQQIDDNPEFQSLELSKIEFNERDGWNIIQINPHMVEPRQLKKALFLIVGHLKNVIFQRLGTMLSLNALNKEVIPFLINSWDTLSAYDLSKPLLSIFLTHNASR